MSGDDDFVRIVLCYNGSKTESRSGIVFEGEKRGTRINRNSTIEELHEKIKKKILCTEANVSISMVTARIWCDDKYSSMKVIDDEDLEFVIGEFFNQSRKKYLELYVDFGGVEDVALPTRSVDFNYSRGASASAAAVGNMSMEDENDPTWVMDDDIDDDDDDENIAMEDRLLAENASASDNDEDDGRSARQIQVHYPVVREHSTQEQQDAGESHLPQQCQGDGNTTFWDGIPHYTYINWDYPSEQDSGSGCGSGSVEGPWVLGNKLFVKQEFASKEDVQMAIKRNLMKEHQEAIVVESTPRKLIMRCRAYDQNCPWRVRVIKPTYGERWVVTKWGGDHNCLNHHISQDHRQLDVNVIVSLVLGMIKHDPSCSIGLVQERITHSYGYKVSYRKAWYAKQKAMAIIYGDWEESYAFLPRWCEYMLRFSPGSFYQLQTKNYYVAHRIVRGKRVFQRIFWTFRQCCEAFNFCKPVIQIDGTHLYGKYKGKLLIATAQDGNNECLPIAFAIVEGETLEAWEFFLDNIRSHVTQKTNLCLISDRHRSILSAVERHPGWQPPHAYHVFCLRHIASNFNQKFRDEKLKKAVMTLGYTPSIVDFDVAFANFRDVSPDVANWIDSIPKEKWTRAYDVEGRRYGHMTTNLAESVNRVLKGARNMPITALVKHTYSRLVEYFVCRGRSALNELQGPYPHCKNVVAMLKANETSATGHYVRAYNVERSVFEVDDGYHKSYSVNLPERICQCGKFKAFKYPCSHAAAAALHVRQSPAQYVDDVFLISNLVQAYSFPWQPIGNEQAIPPSDDPVVIPDREYLRAAGRPKSTRIRNEMDEVEASQSRIKCGICRLPGHNRRNCPSRPSGP